MDDAEVPVVHITPVNAAIRTFDPSEATLSTWVELFEEYCIANDIPDEPAAVGEAPPVHNRKRAIFLSYVGPRAYEVLRTTCLPDRPNQRAIPTLITILRDHYEPPGLRRANRLTFSKRNQRDSETATEFISAIQDLASRCEFGAQLNDSLLDRLISGIKNNELRIKLLSRADLTYQAAKELIIQQEAVRLEARALAQSVQIGNVRSSSFHSTRPNSGSTSSHKRPNGRYFNNVKAPNRQTSAPNFQAKSKKFIDQQTTECIHQFCIFPQNYF